MGSWPKTADRFPPDLLGGGGNNYLASAGRVMKSLHTGRKYEWTVPVHTVPVERNTLIHFVAVQYRYRYSYQLPSVDHLIFVLLITTVLASECWCHLLPLTASDGKPHLAPPITITRCSLFENCRLLPVRTWTKNYREHPYHTGTVRNDGSSWLQNERHAGCSPQRLWQWYILWVQPI